LADDGRCFRVVFLRKLLSFGVEICTCLAFWISRARSRILWVFLLFFAEMKTTGAHGTNEHLYLSLFSICFLFVSSMRSDLLTAIMMPFFSFRAISNT